MEPANINENEVLLSLKTDLFNSIKNNKYINIHICSETISISNCILAKEVNIEKSIEILSGHFEFCFNMKNSKDFELFIDEYDHTYHIFCDNVWIDFDFND